MDVAEFFAKYGDDLAKLFVYGVGIAAFTLIVAMLYMPMSHRLMFGRRKGEKDVSTEGRKLVYVLLFPLVSFAFFLVMVGALLFLSATAKSKLPVTDLLTISMGIVLAIRITAYFHEKAAEELGKIMPLGLLGVFLVTNTGELSLKDSFAELEKIPDNLDLVAIFFIVIVLAEFLLRGIYAIFNRTPKRPAHKPTPPSRPK